MILKTILISAIHLMVFLSTSVNSVASNTNKTIVANKITNKSIATKKIVNKSSVTKQKSSTNNIALAKGNQLNQQKSQQASTKTSQNQKKVQEKPKIVPKPPKVNLNITLPENIRHQLFTNATVEQYPLLNLTDSFHKFDENKIKEPLKDNEYRFVNSSMDYINYIKKIAQDEQTIDLENIEEIHLRNVVLKDEDPEIKQKVLVRELIVLNSPDDDPDDATVIVNKAVIVPSISEDHTLDKLKQKMYARATMKYNSKIDKLMALLNSLQLHKTSSHKAIVHNKKHLDQAKVAINNLKVPVLKRKHTLTKIEGEMDEFREKVADHVQESIDMVNTDSQRKSMQSMRNHLSRMRKRMKKLKSDLYSDEFEHSDAKDNEIRHQMMELADDMAKLNQKMKSLHKHTEDIDKKVQKHHRKIRKMIYDHNKKIEETIDHDDFSEDDFVSAKEANKRSREDSDLKSRGFKMSNDWTA